MAMRSSITFLAIALFASGCAHYPINAPLAAVDGRTGYRFENTAFSTNSDDLLLMLAFSGGGTRAAALDYGVLEELARTGVGPPSEQHRLLDEVDLISSVSGGSFTAAYYALWATASFRISIGSFSRNVSTMHCASASWPHGIRFGCFRQPSTGAIWLPSTTTSFCLRERPLAI